MVQKGRRQDRDGWMDVAMMRILLINRHMSYNIVTANQIVSFDIAMHIHTNFHDNYC